MSRAGSRRTRLLFLSHSHMFGTFRVGSHHYAREFALRGDEVVHLSTPVSLAHRLTGRVDRGTASALPSGPHEDEDGVVHIVPRTALPLPLSAFTVTRELRRHGISPHFDFVLLDQPLLWDRTVRSLAPRLIYRPTDLYPAGIKNALQSRIMGAADAVVATSSEVLRSLGSTCTPTHVLGNGVDERRFIPMQSTKTRRNACIYVGALDDRFDWAQVSAWASTHPDISFEIVGPGTAPFALPDNVRLIGPIAYEALPSLLHRARVGMLPLSDALSNTGRSPMKLYEYLAAGLSVVTRTTPVLTPNAALGVFSYRARVDADAALDAALAFPSPNLDGMNAARAESWSAKAQDLREFLESLPPS